MLTLFYVCEKCSNHTRSHPRVLKERQEGDNKASGKNNLFFSFSFQIALPDVVVLARCEPAVIEDSHEESSEEQDHHSDPAPRRKALTNRQGKSKGVIIAEDEAEDEADDEEKEESADDSSEHEKLDTKAFREKIWCKVFFYWRSDLLSVSDLVAY